MVYVWGGGADHSVWEYGAVRNFAELYQVISPTCFRIVWSSLGQSMNCELRIEIINMKIGKFLQIANIDFKNIY